VGEQANVYECIPLHNSVHTETCVCD